MDKWIVAPLWPGPEREREEREYYCGPGAQQPATSPELQIRRCKIDDTLHFSHYGFLFFAAPASFHAHSFLASLFVYRAFVYQLFLSLCKEYGKKLVDTQSRARLSDVLSKNNLMSSHADIQTVKSICCLLPMIQYPMSNESGSWQLIWSPRYFLLSTSPMFVIVTCQLLGLCGSVAV